ncbi:MAG: hypothetical protein ABUT39_09370, partial [Acidobacteriota bacterium]
MLRTVVRNLVVPIGFAFLASAVHAGQFELLSRAGDESDTATGFGSLPIDQRTPVVSADGRWIAFASSAVNLAAGQKDLNGAHDAFLLDRQTGTTVLVSHAAGSLTTAASGGVSFPTSISDDGRWLVYQSTADDLVPGQVATSSSAQVLLYDRDTGASTLVSHSTAGPAVTGNGQSSAPRISGDGNWVAFESGASDLLAGSGPQNYWDVFLYERATGQTTLVSRAAGTTLTFANHQSFRPTLSHDGRWVAFRSEASDLIPGFSFSSSPWHANAFLFDRVTGAMTLVSRTSASATTGASGWYPEVSPDGAAVIFPSNATDLVPGQIDVADTWDIFLFNRASGTNVLVSHAPGSPTTGTSTSEQPGQYQVSSGGDWVVFSGLDDQARYQVYLFRRSDSSVSLVSRSTASPSFPIQGGNNYSMSPWITPDGAFVAFTSRATDLVPGQAGPDTYNAYLFDRVAGTLALASGSGGSGSVAGNGSSEGPTVSADGSVAAWYTWATDLGNGATGAADLNGTADMALYDRSTAATTLATLHAPGMASSTASGSSRLVSASADGRYAVFLSTAVNVVPGQVNRNDQNVFLVDRVAGTTTLVSRAAGLSATTTADDDALDAVISADGAYIAFVSQGRDHVPGQVDTNIQYHEYLGSVPGPDVFLYDRAAGTTVLVSHAAGSSVTAGEYPCFFPVSLSADGRYVAFGCDADDLVAGQDDANFGPDIFLYDRVAGTTVLVSRKAGMAAKVAEWPSYEPALSADGRWVAFTSYATDLVAGGTDSNGQSDIFLFDRDSGQTLLVSRAAGTAATAADRYSQQPALSPDGRYVVFTSASGNLVPGQSGPVNLNLFLFDRVTGVVELISR